MQDGAARAGTIMPIYEYRCKECEHEVEALQKLSDPPLVACPACGKPALQKLVSAAGFQLKGSGWYVTDFRGGANAAKPADAPAGADAKAGEGAPATEAKPADAPAASPSADAGSASSDGSSGGAVSAAGCGGGCACH